MSKGQKRVNFWLWNYLEWYWCVRNETIWLVGRHHELAWLGYIRLIRELRQMRQIQEEEEEEGICLDNILREKKSKEITPQFTTITGRILLVVKNIITKLDESLTFGNFGSEILKCVICFGFVSNFVERIGTYSSQNLHNLHYKMIRNSAISC